jgi:hypothetical protein
MPVPGRLCPACCHAGRVPVGEILYRPGRSPNAGRFDTPRCIAVFEQAMGVDTARSTGQNGVRTREADMLRIDDVTRLAEALPGVRSSTVDGLAQWRYRGRLVARQLDDVQLVIRADFDYRASILHSFPGTFSVPDRYRKHMMIVADLAHGDPGAIEDALAAAWQLQRDAG